MHAEYFTCIKHVEYTCTKPSVLNLKLCFRFADASEREELNPFDEPTTPTEKKERVSRADSKPSSPTKKTQRSLSFKADLLTGSTGTVCLALFSDREGAQVDKMLRSW